MPDLTLLPILLIGAFVHGALGFGFPLLSTPALLLFLELPTVILLTLVPTVSINLVSIVGERHWRAALTSYWAIPAFTIGGSLAGTQLMLRLDPEPLRLLLAFVVTVYLLTEREHGSEVERRVPRWAMALFGFVLGLLGGMTNIIAPAIVIYALYTRMQPVLMVATFNLSFLISKSGQIIGFVANDALDPDIVMLSLQLLPLVLISLWLGMRLRRRMNLDSYRRWLRYALWGIVVLLVADTLAPRA
jgi:uncharacterized membrane protein YfcA